MIILYPLSHGTCVCIILCKDFCIIDLILTDSSNGNTGRFLGFSLYVSNTTERSKGKMCFKDTSFTRGTIPPVFTVTCPVQGQYVIYYNERLPGVVYPNGYSYYAYLDLCEVEVYGKHVHIHLSSEKSFFRFV